MVYSGKLARHWVDNFQFQIHLLSIPFSKLKVGHLNLQRNRVTLSLSNPNPAQNP